MSNGKASKRYCLKILLTAEQKDFVWKINGPNRFVSARIREQILNPYNRKNPDQWAAFVGSVNAIEASLEKILRGMNPDSPASICDFIQACYAANKLLVELRRHEP